MSDLMEKIEKTELYQYVHQVYDFLNEEFALCNYSRPEEKNKAATEVIGTAFKSKEFEEMVRLYTEPQAPVGINNIPVPNQNSTSYSEYGEIMLSQIFQKEKSKFLIADKSGNFEIKFYEKKFENICASRNQKTLLNIKRALKNKKGGWQVYLFYETSKAEEPSVCSEWYDGEYRANTFSFKKYTAFLSKLIESN